MNPTLKKANEIADAVFADLTSEELKLAAFTLRHFSVYNEQRHILSNVLMARAGVLEA